MPAVVEISFNWVKRADDNGRSRKLLLGCMFGKGNVLQELQWNTIYLEYVKPALNYETMFLYSLDA